MGPPVSLHVCSFYYQQLESFHDYSFHIPHMDPPVSLKCLFSSETTHGSNSVIACVLFLLTTTSVIACVFFSLTTARFIACVFSSETTHGSTSVIACVLFLLTTTGVIACVFFSHTTYGSTSVIEMCDLFRDHTWIHQCHCMCVLFTNNNWGHCMCDLFTNNNQSHCMCFLFR